MNVTYFDIETGPLPDAELFATIPPFDPSEVKTGNIKDPEKIAAKIKECEVNYWNDIRDQAALSPVTGQVLAIGLETDRSAHLIAYDEEDTLNCFWSQFEDSFNYFIGFNIFNFDLPFLIKRSWKLGVIVPKGVRHGRYWSDRFIDLRDLWQMGDRQAKGSLDVICRHFGIEGKNGSGKDFARMFELNREKALEYLTNDLRMTRNVHQIMTGGDK
jgi:hypothetical protein